MVGVAVGVGEMVGVSVEMGEMVGAGVSVGLSIGVSEIVQVGIGSLKAVWPGERVRVAWETGLLTGWLGLVRGLHPDTSTKASTSNENSPHRLLGGRARFVNGLR